MPFLWFDDQAEDAANFYTSLFSDSKMGKTTNYDEASAKASGRPAGSVMTIAFEIGGQSFGAINGGPIFKINPSVSFFVYCKTGQEMDKLWKEFSDGGNVFMKLDKYPFSEKYGWIQDRYGVSWQLILGDNPHKIIPCLMFTGPQQGKAEPAIHYYTSVFRDAKIIMNEHYDEDEMDIDATVVHAEFELCGQPFIAMDSRVPMPDVSFNEAVSLVINCESQEEVDYYWNKLTKGGDETAQQCGWLRDKFGFSWQVVPVAMHELLGDPDPQKAGRVMAAMLRMKKIDLGVLRQAALAV